MGILLVWFLMVIGKFEVVSIWVIVSIVLIEVGWSLD